MKFFLSPVLIVSFVLFHSSANAETIYLKDGSSVIGTIKEITTHSVIIVTTQGEMSIEGEKILRLGEALPAKTETELCNQQKEYWGVGQAFEAINELFGAQKKNSGCTIQANIQVSGTQEISSVPTKTEAEFRLQEKDGLGIGIDFNTNEGACVVCGNLMGTSIFYDHNLSSQSQIHSQLKFNQGRMFGTVLVNPVLESTREMVFATYRAFWSENRGYYWGVGGGYAASELTYDFPGISGGTPTHYKSQQDGIFAVAEVGWQGNNGYYFNIGIQPAAYISSSDNFDLNKIPDISNHKSAANTEHSNLKNLTELSIGFGWFF